MSTMDCFNMECQELQCSVCGEGFSDHQLPRNLPCGHSVCSSCISSLIIDDRRCPECRKKFEEDDVAKFPVNYPLLNISYLAFQGHDKFEKLPQLEFQRSCSSPVAKQNAGTCLVHDLPLFFMCFSCGVWICRECLAVEHLDPPRGNCFILSAEDAINRIKRSHLNTLGNYIPKSEILRYQWVKQVNLFDIGLKHLRFLSQLDVSVNGKDIEEIERQRREAAAYLSSLENTDGSLKDANEKLQISTAPQDVISAMHLSTAAQMEFEKISQEEVSLEFPSILKFLLKDKQKIIELLEKGKPVYISNITNGREQWSKITTEDNQLYVYSLRSGKLPEDGIPFPLETIHAVAPKESPMIFMDIGWKGEIKGRVSIRMFGDTPRGRQAVLLCSGEKGPSYRGTKFSHSFNDSNNEPYLIHSAEYPDENGQGGYAIVDDIVDSDEYTHQVKPGLICGVYASWTSRLGHFSVYLKERPYEEKCAFGCVEQGLNVLKETTEIYPLANSSVMECGLIIPV